MACCFSQQKINFRIEPTFHKQVSDRSGRLNGFTVTSFCLAKRSLVGILRIAFFLFISSCECGRQRQQTPVIFLANAEQMARHHTLPVIAHQHNSFSLMPCLRKSSNDMNLPCCPLIAADKLPSLPLLFVASSSHPFLPLSAFGH